MEEKMTRLKFMSRIGLIEDYIHKKNIMPYVQRHVLEALKAIEKEILPTLKD